MEQAGLPGKAMQVNERSTNRAAPRGRQRGEAGRGKGGPDRGDGQTKKSKEKGENPSGAAATGTGGPQQVGTKQAFLANQEKQTKGIKTDHVRYASHKKRYKSYARHAFLRAGDQRAFWLIWAPSLAVFPQGLRKENRHPLGCLTG